MEFYLFQPFSAAEIHPKGWFFRLLETQKEGLSGHVPEIWADLSDDSAWLGGSGEAWERGPYYLDGLVPLAWLTKDPELIERKNRWVEALLKSQTEDGNFGPRRNSDIWPRLVAMKALWEEWEASRDSRIPDFLIRYCHFVDDTILFHPPKFWASARALEALGPMLLLRELTQETFLDGLILKLRDSMVDWFGLFRNFPYVKPTGNYLSKTLFAIAKTILSPLDVLSKKSLRIRDPESAESIRAFNARKSTRLMVETHGVNLAMALKYPVMMGSFLGDSDLISLGKTAYHTLMKHHGTALGIHSADEHLSGHESFQGTELCAVVEEMYSFEEMLRTTGDVEYVDLLEYLAFNALPGMFTPDMCRHQYVGQVNQIAADRHRRPFFDTNKEGNIYGLAPNYGCCLANMHQGFPKYALNQIFRTKTGLAITGYAPFTLESTMFGEPLKIDVSGEYPFRNAIVIRLERVPSTRIRVDFRIPRGTTGLVRWNDKMLGQFEPGMVSLEELFSPGDEIRLDLETPVLSIPNGDGSVSFRKGSLLLALPLKPQEVRLRGNGRFTDLALKTQEVWNVAIDPPKFPSEDWKWKTNPLSDLPFDSQNPPLEVQVAGYRIPAWKMRRGCTDTVPSHPLRGEKVLLRLVPFGCTNLRIAAFPDLRR